MSHQKQLRALDLFCGDGGATKGLQEAGFHVTGVDIVPRPRYCGDVFVQADALTFPLDCSRCLGPALTCCDCQGKGFDPKPWDFIWASPPCQAFSRLRHLHAKDHPNLIPATRARLIKSGRPYCIENVEGSPLGKSGYLIMLCGTMFGLQTRDGRGELRRHRLFETSFSIPLRPACQHGTSSPLSVCGKGGHFSARKVLTVCGHTPVDNTKRQTITVTSTGLDDNRMRAFRRTVSVTGSTAQTNVVRNQVREVFTVQQAREAMGIDWMSMKGLSQAIPPHTANLSRRNF